MNINIKAGEALLFDSRMIHGSPPNQSDKIRPAIVSGWIPEEATPIVYMSYDGVPDGQLELFETTPEFYANVIINERPKGAQSLGFHNIEPIELNKEEFLAIVGTQHSV
jgi:ectoine hydroxylase-related dioxygenase (phytanoyl-CoA dioxygenase family)